MTTEERNEIFHRYEKLIYHLAKKFSVQYNLPYQELVGEGCHAFLMYLEKWWEEKFNTSISKETTWAYLKIYWSLKNICIKMTKAKTVPLEIRNRIFEPEAKPNWLARLLSEVSEEGKFLIKTIITAPGEIAEDVSVKTCGRARKAIKDYLIEEKKWDPNKLFKTWEEVKSCL